MDEGDWGIPGWVEGGVGGGAVDDDGYEAPDAKDVGSEREKGISLYFALWDEYSQSTHHKQRKQSPSLSPRQSLPKVDEHRQPKNNNIKHHVEPPMNLIDSSELSCSWSSVMFNGKSLSRKLDGSPPDAQNNPKHLPRVLTAQAKKGPKQTRYVHLLMCKVDGKPHRYVSL